MALNNYLNIFYNLMTVISSKHIFIEISFVNFKSKSYLSK